MSCVESGSSISTSATCPARCARGDLWAPLAIGKKRVRLPSVCRPRYRGWDDPDWDLRLALRSLAGCLVSRGPRLAPRAGVLRTSLFDRGDQRILLFAPGPRELRCRVFRETI